jgi:hypothetical protein
MSIMVYSHVDIVLVVSVVSVIVAYMWIKEKL